jgi:Zn-dependent protease with chaperone function
MAAAIGFVVASPSPLLALIPSGLLFVAGVNPFLPRRQRHQAIRLDPARHADLFEWVSSVAGELGTKPPRHIDIALHWNASVHRSVRGRVLTLGVPLWMSLNPQERLAVIGHEMGHFVNGDTNRGVVVWTAHSALWEWERAFAEIARPAARAFAWPVRLMIRALIRLFSRLGFVTSQRAEYFADLAAARLASTEAMSSALAVTRSGHFTWELSLRRAKLGVLKDGYWHQLTSLISAVPADERRRRRRAAELDVESLPFSSHPSTGQRIKVLQAHSVPFGSGPTVNMAAIDEALRPTIGVLVPMANKGKTTRRPVPEGTPA